MIAKCVNGTVMTRVTHPHCERCSPLQQKTDDKLAPPVNDWIVKLLKNKLSALQIFELSAQAPIEGMQFIKITNNLSYNSVCSNVYRNSKFLLQILK